ncbi:PAS domain-containing protein [Methylobacterium oryzae CBMB20]
MNADPALAQPARPGAPGPETEALRQIVDAAAGLILRLDGEGRVTFASAGGLSILGTVAAALLGQPLRDALHPEDAGVLADAAGAGPVRYDGRPDARRGSGLGRDGAGRARDRGHDGSRRDNPRGLGA